jgi:site-specific recombinase XerD
MARQKNLKIQLNQQLDALLRIGQSRHDEKQKFGQNNVKTIHSISTAENYRQVINQFANWLREEKQDIWQTKNINSITDDVAKDYLHERQARGLSAYTLSRDMASLNKVLNKSLTKANSNIKKRSYKDLERSRHNTNEKLNPNILHENREQILIAKTFGLRRFEIDNLEKRNFKYNIKGEVIGLTEVKGKGGKIRDVDYIIKEHSKEVKDLISNKKNGLVFNSYNTKIDNHAFRREYAQKLYERREQDFKQSRTYLGDKIQNKWYKNVLKDISKVLGHNRIDVTIYHYLK